MSMANYWIRQINLKEVAMALQEWFRGASFVDMADLYAHFDEFFEGGFRDVTETEDYDADYLDSLRDCFNYSTNLNEYGEIWVFPVWPKPGA